MRFSISIKQEPDGFIPRLVVETPKAFEIISAKTKCTTWKEAWIYAKVHRRQLLGKEIVVNASEIR